MQPMTKKARQAIETYAFHRCGGLHIANFLIEYTLKADRMPREKLYQWLERKGYKWSSRYSMWRKINRK